jgi:hypothetical protein
MADKFIPDGDLAFCRMACKFARSIERDPARFKLSGDDAALIRSVVKEFEAAYRAATNKAVRSVLTVRAKDDSRLKAQRLIERYGRLIRADDSISAACKLCLDIRERPAKLKPRTCPQTRPLLTFRGARDATSMRGPMHVLEFREEEHLMPTLKEMAPRTFRAKPAGAARVEVYVELVDEGEPIPKHPAELSGGRPWYLRSFSRTPMEVEVPVCPRPMMVVYWACWADTKGERGPFSTTCVARGDGWSSLRAALPDPSETRQRQQRIVITSARRELPEPLDQVEEIAVRAVKLLEQPI